VPSQHPIIPLFHHSRCERSEPKLNPRQHWFLKKIQLSIFLLNTIGKAFDHFYPDGYSIDFYTDITPINYGIPSPFGTGKNL
jgi:hypothetical protein